MIVGTSESRLARMLSHLVLAMSAVVEHASCDIMLPIPTFTAAAEMAGISRVMGGYHIQADNVAGLKLGRDVANYIWPEIQRYFDGTAKPIYSSKQSQLSEIR